MFIFYLQKWTGQLAVERSTTTCTETSLLGHMKKVRYIMSVNIINVLNVVCLEDGTLVWYDQSTEGIALAIFYLRFIPPSPCDEAGQDKRNIPSWESWYLPANSGGCQVKRPNSQTQCTGWNMANLVQFYLHFLISTYSRKHFSPVELEYPSQYFRIDCIIMIFNLGSISKYQPEKEQLNWKGAQFVIRTSFSLKKTNVVNSWPDMKYHDIFHWSVLKFVLIHQ